MAGEDNTDSLCLTESELEDTSLASIEGTTGLLEDTSSSLRSRSTPFPVKDFSQVMEGLNRYPGWTVYPEQLGKCITCTTAILHQNSRVPSPERAMISKLIREAIPSSFEKCIEDPCQGRWQDSVQIDIFVAAMQLIDLVIQRLQDMALGSSKDPELLPAVEEDLLMLFDAWHRLCDPLMPFHLRNKDADLPVPRVEEYPPDYAVPAIPPGPAPVSSSNSSTSADEIPAPEYLWLANLLNAFGAKKGFELVCQVLQMADVSYTLVDTLLAPILKAVNCLTPPTLAAFVDPLHTLLRRMEGQLTEDPELLTDQGRDRMFNSASGSLSRINKLLSLALSVQQADQEVGHVQRQFVLCLLGQSSFSKHLTAVRETNTLLKRAVEIRAADQGHSVKVNVDWLRDHDIVKQLLRANLHQKQYVDQVQKVLKNLTIEGGLQEDHLELLWNLTEKVDTFEAVKNNVYTMLGDLAQDFNGNQMDLLFNKFEACSSLSRQTDTVKVMNLIRQLAVSDSKKALASRILGLLWEMVMNPEAPPELSRGNGLVEAISHYGEAYAWDYMQRCVQKVASNDNAHTALHMLRRLCEVGVLRQADAVLNHKTIQMLEDNCHLQEVVVSSFEAFMAEVVKAESLDPEVHTRETGYQRLRFQMMEYVHFLHYFARIQGENMPVQVYERLWQCWLERAQTPWILDVGFQWFASCVLLISPASAAMLLEGRITAIPPARTRFMAWHCFFVYFREVGVAEGNLLPAPPREDKEAAQLMDQYHVEDLDLTGLDHLWRLALEADQGKVAAEAACTIVQLTLQLGPRLVEDQASVRAGTIKRLLEKLGEADAGLRAARRAQPPQEAAVERHGVHASRCLRLLQELVDKCQGRIMPARPAHAASFQGLPLRMEVQAQMPAKGLHGSSRIRVQTFDNAYVGQLRRQIAAQLQTYPSNLRLLASGRELSSDAKLVKEARLGDSHVLLAMATPVQLDYTLPVSGSADSPAELVACQEGLYDILLRLADERSVPDVSLHAGSLLGMLPTWAEVRDAMVAAIADPAAAAQLGRILSPQADGSPAQGRHARLLYLLEALTGVLYPMQPQGEAEAAPAVLQHSFIRSGCISAMLDAVADVMAEPPGEIPVDPGTLRGLNCTCQQLVLQLALVMRSPAATPTPATPRQPTASRDVSMATSPQSVSATSRSMASCDTPATQQPVSMEEVDLAGEDAASQQAPQPDHDMLIKMATFFISVAHFAARGWRTGPMPDFSQLSALDTPLVDVDVALHHDALIAIKEILDTNSSVLLSRLLESPFAEGLRRSLLRDLLTPQHEAVRARTAKLADRLARAPQGHAWVLRLLLPRLAAADACPFSCGDFYGVVCQLLTVKPLPSTVPREELQRLLAGLVEQACRFEAVHSQDLRLEGKLRLVLALVRVLGRYSFDDSRLGGSLAFRLLTDFLFPEAYAEHKLAERQDSQLASLDPGVMHAAMKPRCNSAPCRKAAFELLAELMLHDATILNEGVGLLMDLHFDPQRPSVLQLQQYNNLTPHTSRNAEGFVGLKNGSATCYMNAVFQQLFMAPGLRTAVLAEPEEPAATRKESVFYQMQSAFAHLALSRQQAYKPAGIWHAFKDYDGEPINVREHQDAQEFLTRLQDLVDQHLRDRGRQPIMQAQFGGKVATQIVCRSVPYRSEKEEDFIQVGLDVRGKHDLEESLDFYVQSELMEGENQYLCEEAGRKVDAVRGICFKALPDTLCIHLKRFEYDYEQMTRWKIKDRFEFPLELNMYKYTKAAADAREAAEAAAEGPGPCPAAEAAEGAASADCHYELRGIVVHSGTANAGHYYSYIKVRQEPGLGCAGRWFCFDDTSVEPWDIAHLERDCFGGRHIPETGYYSSKMQEVERPNSAYLLFYDRISSSQASPAADHAPAPMVDGESVPPTHLGTPVQEEVPSRSGRISVVPIPPVEQTIPSIYQDVMSNNLRLLSRQNLLDRDYYSFMLHLLEADSQASSHKVRRTGAASSPSARSPSNTPPHSTDEGRSSSGAAADSMAASSASSTSPYLPPGPDRSAASPGRRTLDLALHFLFRAYLRSHAALRLEMPSWRVALLSVLEHDSYARRRLLEVASTVQHTPGTGLEDAEPPLEFSAMFLIHTDQADVRQLMVELVGTALTGAALHDGGTPLAGPPGQEAPEPGSAARAVEALLTRLRRALRAEIQRQQQEQQPGGGAFVRRLMVFDAYTPLVEYAGLGMQQVAHLSRLNYLPHALKAAETAFEMYRMNDASWQDMLPCYKLVAHLGRRVEESSERPNPFRSHVEGVPPVKHEQHAKLHSSAMSKGLLVPRLLLDQTCRTLLKFLQWQHQQFSYQVVSEVLHVALKDVEFSHCTAELADALSLRDAWLHGRMTMLIGGSGGGPHQPSHHQGLARMLMHVQLHDVRRISMLKLVVSLADSHQEVEATILAQSCNWAGLYSWLHRRVQEVAHEGMGATSPRQHLQHVLVTLQRWSYPPEAGDEPDEDDAEDGSPASPSQ